jgi:hypothetical protein
MAQRGDSGSAPRLLLAPALLAPPATLAPPAPPAPPGPPGPPAPTDLAELAGRRRPAAVPAECLPA